MADTNPPGFVEGDAAPVKTTQPPGFVQGDPAPTVSTPAPEQPAMMGLNPEQDDAYAAVSDKVAMHTQPGAIMEVLKQSFKLDEPLGLSPSTVQEMRDIGIFNDVSKGEEGMRGAFTEGVLRPAAIIGDVALRDMNAVAGVAGLAVDKTASALGLSQQEGPETQVYHAQQFANDLMMVTAFTPEGLVLGKNAALGLPGEAPKPPIPPSAQRDIVVAPKPWQAESVPVQDGPTIHLPDGTVPPTPNAPPINNLPVPGSPEAKAAETPVPATTTGPIQHESPVLDGSGNLNVNYIRADQDTKDIMAQTSEAYAQKYGSVQTHVETEAQGNAAFEEALNQTTNGIPDVLADYMRGDRINTDDVWIARQVSVQLGVQFSKLAKVANSTGTPEDLAAAQEAFSRMVHVVGPIRHEMTAEAGRILNSFKIPVGEDGAALTEEATLKLAGLTPEDAMRIAGNLDTPQAVAKFVQDVQKPSFADMGLYYVFNNYLSGPLTHLAYAASWGIETVFRAGIDTPIAATVGRIQKWAGKTLEPEEVNALAAERNALADRLAEADSTQGRKLTAAESQTMEARLKEIKETLNKSATVLPHEAAARFYGIGEGALDSLKAGWRALKTADIQYLPGEMKKAEQAAKDAEAAAIKEGKTADEAKQAGRAAYQDNATNFGNPIVERGKQIKNPIVSKAVQGVGQVVGVPMRVIAGLHSAQKFSVYAESMNALAYRQAAMEGLEGDKLASRIAALKNNPSEEMMKAARDQSLKAALMGESGPVGKAFQKFANSSAWTRTVIPFSKVSTNLTSQKVLEHTPVGFLSTKVRGDLMGANGNAAQATAIAGMARGTTLLTGGAYLAAKGISTGWTEDKNERDFKKRLGQQPYSLNMGDLNMPHRFFGVNGGSLSLGADIHEISQYIDQNDLGWKDFLQIVGTSIHYTGKDIMGENAIKGVADLYNAIDDRENAAKYYVPNAIASAFVPFSSFQSQIGHRFIDPIMRQTAGQDSYDTLMQTIQSRSMFSSKDLTPQIDVIGNPAQYNYDHTEAMKNPVFTAMDQVGIYPSKLQNKLFGVALDEKQYAVYGTLAGKGFYNIIYPQVTNPNWVRMTDKAQADAIQAAIKMSRAQARATMTQLYPQIVKDSAQQKMDLLHQYDADQ